MAEETREQLLAKADAYYSVGEVLKYEYEGPYTREDIEEFFDKKADEIYSEAYGK